MHVVWGWRKLSPHVCHFSAPPVTYKIQASVRQTPALPTNAIVGELIN